MLGNVGTQNFGERIAAGDVYQSLTQLMPILEWYFEVERLLDADTPGVPAIIAAMKGYRRWVDPELQERLPKLPEDSHQKPHASLALLPDQGQVEFLYRRLLGASPTELPVIWTLLGENQHALVPRL
jgi:hypothetical protein